MTKGALGPISHRRRSSSADRSRRTFRIDGDIAGDHQCESSIPIGGFDPIQSVEQGCGTAITGLLRINRFGYRCYRIWRINPSERFWPL